MFSAAIMAAAFFYFYLPGPSLTVPQVLKSPGTQPAHSHKAGLSVPVQKEAKARIDAKKFCEPENILKELAKTCDRRCLFEHLGKTDPELLATFRELENPKQKNIRSKLVRFMNAVEFSSEGPKIHESILRELSAEDPQNAYPAFYLASFIREREDESKAVLAEAVTRKNYEPYYLNFLRRLKKATIHRDDLYARGHLEKNRLTRPSVNASIFWSFQDLDEDLAKMAALKIIQPAIESGADYRDILWEREDYAMTMPMLAAIDSTAAAFVPDFDIGDVFTEKLAPGVSQEDCSAKAFRTERLRESVVLSRPGRN